MMSPILQSRAQHIFSRLSIDIYSFRPILAKTLKLIPAISCKKRITENKRQIDKAFSDIRTEPSESVGLFSPVLGAERRQGRVFLYEEVTWELLRQCRRFIKCIAKAANQAQCAYVSGGKTYDHLIPSRHLCQSCKFC